MYLMHMLRKHMFNFSFSRFINCLNEVTQRELCPSAIATKKDACDNENKPDANSKINEKVVGKTPQNLSSSNIISPQTVTTAERLEPPCPSHLPRTEQEKETEEQVCPQCGHYRHKEARGG